MAKNGIADEPARDYQLQNADVWTFMKIFNHFLEYEVNYFWTMPTNQISQFTDSRTSLHRILTRSHTF